MSRKINLLLESLSLLGLLIGFFLLAFYWSSLPESIPRHFNALGEPDAWTDSKGGVLILPIISIILYMKLTIIARYAHKLQTRKTALNPEQQILFVRSTLSWVKAEIIWLFAYIEWKIIQVSLGTAEGLGTAFLPVFLILVLGTAGIFAFKGLKTNRTI